MNGVNESLTSLGSESACLSGQSTKILFNYAQSFVSDQPDVLHVCLIPSDDFNIRLGSGPGTSVERMALVL